VTGGVILLVTIGLLAFIIYRRRKREKNFLLNGGMLLKHQRVRIFRSTWKNRLRIATEIAQALDYLHSLANPPIIHGDIKSTNILLDEGFRAKATAMFDKIQGTLGYLDPEYLVTGNLTPMSDVYSFGVVMVELLTGRKPYSGSSTRTEEKVNLVQYFLSSVGDMNLGRIVNFVVAREGEMEEIEAFAEVARRCLSSSGIKRPVMKEVAEELGRLLRRLDKNSWESDRKGDNGGEEMECLLRKNGGESCSMSFGGGSEFWSVRTEEPPATETHSIVAMEMGSYEIFR
ncbi:unnamed protein product, partial [Linum tenue]